ncbi:hypothetical protein QAD02_013080 [Eretmocerus hayati]|uniref:Uncharacterized protein n=1 Tax=Eretmocerus hayati TaxID=131215 RepID=A0ACC2P2H6_9HYME|nr:hypothetical protein QAD02_013080 [Eretmocerus hayati]
MGVPQSTSSNQNGVPTSGVQTAQSDRTAIGGNPATVTAASAAIQRINHQELADNQSRENQVTGNFDNSKNNSSLKSVSEEIKLTFSTKGEGVKRDYKLTDELNFDHFYDFLTMELRTDNLLHIVKPESQKGVDLDEAVLEKQRFRVRDILMNRISTKYYAMVSGITDPIEILNKLREMKECEINVVTDFCGMLICGVMDMCVCGGSCILVYMCAPRETSRIFGGQAFVTRLSVSSAQRLAPELTLPRAAAVEVSQGELSLSSDLVLFPRCSRTRSRGKCLGVYCGRE